MTCPISVLILTYNEESNLPGLLESVRDWTEAIYVVDSGSTDRTVEIAEGYGAVVRFNPWTTPADQFNWGLDNMPIATPWVIRFDADERATPELAQELQQRLPSLAESVTGLYVKYKNFFLGRWIRYGGVYPIWLLRVFRYQHARCENRTMDEHIVLLSGRAERLKYDFIHDSTKDLRFFTIKHETYAEREALEMYHDPSSQSSGTLPANLFGPQNQRKRWLKGNVYGRSPLFLRAMAYFLYRYFFRLGFLDGPQGLIFHVLQGFWYRFYVDAKIWEMRYQQRLGQTNSAEPQRITK
jgi:glycosyltransferase involved in cell wall biosynthesis